MPLIGRRPLLRAGMVGSAGYAAGRRRGAGAEARATAGLAPPPATAVAAPASAETERIDALTKLEGLLDSGVLTREQYESERARLTAGI
jgi:hypothetical protein